MDISQLYVYFLNILQLKNIYRLLGTYLAFNLQNEVGFFKTTKKLLIVRLIYRHWLKAINTERH